MVDNAPDSLLTQPMKLAKASVTYVTDKIRNTISK